MRSRARRDVAASRLACGASVSGAPLAPPNVSRHSEAAASQPGAAAFFATVSQPVPLPPCPLGPLLPAPIQLPPHAPSTPLPAPIQFPPHAPSTPLRAPIQLPPHAPPTPLPAPIQLLPPRPYLATGAFSDRRPSANWGFVGPLVQNRYARGLRAADRRVFGRVAFCHLGFCGPLCLKLLRSRMGGWGRACVLGLGWGSGRLGAGVGPGVLGLLGSGCGSGRLETNVASVAGI